MLLLAEEDALDELTTLFANVRHPALAELVEQIEERDGGSALLDTKEGRAAFHVQVLPAATAPRLLVLLPGCDLLLICSSGAAERETVKSLIARVEGASRETRGLLVADGDAARALAEELLKGSDVSRWAPRPPSTASGLLGMLAARGKSA